MKPTVQDVQHENGQLTVAVQPGRPPLKQLEINPPPRPIRHQTVIPRTRQHIHDKRIRLSNGLRTTLGLKHDQNLWFSSSQIVALNLHNCTSPQCRSKLLVVSPSIKRYHRWLIDGPQMDHRFHPCSSYFLYTILYQQHSTILFGRVKHHICLIYLGIFISGPNHRLPPHQIRQWSNQLCTAAVFVATFAHTILDISNTPGGTNAFSGHWSVGCPRNHVKFLIRPEDFQNDIWCDVFNSWEDASASCTVMWVWQSISVQLTSIWSMAWRCPKALPLWWHSCPT